MSHPMYNPRGGPFTSNQRPIVSGQYGLSVQPGLDLGGSRSMSGPGGGMIAPMVSQQMGFPLGQRPSTDLEASIDMNIRGAREEVRLLNQIMQQPKQPDPRLRREPREEVLAPAGGGFPGQRGPGRSKEPSVDWSGYQTPSKLFAPPGLSHSSRGFGSSGGSGPGGLEPPPDRRPARYTSESASSILASFGLSNEDLELLSHYPDDQLTPDNLPFILRDIRLRKAKRSMPDIDARPASDHLSSEPRQSKVIDYGHSSKFGFSEESPEPSYQRDHLANEPPKYGREVSGSPFGGVDISKRPPQPSQAVSVQKKPPPPMNPRKAPPSAADVKTAKATPGRLPAPPQPIPPPAGRPAALPPARAVASRGAMMTLGDVAGGPKPAWPPAFPPPPSNAPGAKRLPTPTMMNDYSAATPRMFPHTCSLCNVECVQIKDWIEHQNNNLHIESCRRLRKQFPDWNVETIDIARNEPTVELRSPKRRTRSQSWSRSPSPRRQHGSSARRRRRSHSRSRSRSPGTRRYRRSRSRSRSPRRAVCISPVAYRRHSRTPPPRRSRSRSRSYGRRSPQQRPARRVSPRRTSPRRHQRASSSERLAKKLIESSAELSSITDSSTLEAMVQSLAPALLAELAKKKGSASSSSAKGGGRKRSASPTSKKSESSKSSTSSTAKTSSFTKNVKPKRIGPGTACLLRFIGVPFGTTHQELVNAISPFGKINNAILLKAIEEASVCMEREEDAKALASCRNLMVHGKIIQIFMEKDAEKEMDSKYQKRPVFRKKEPTTWKPLRTAKAKTPSKRIESTIKKVFQKMPSSAPPRPQEFHWRKNVVEVSGLADGSAPVDELTKLASPYGFTSVPVVAMIQRKAFLEMPNATAAEDMVKAFSETPAKVQGTDIAVRMMTQPIDLKHTESLFRVLIGMENPTDIATLPERLLTVGNVPRGSAAASTVRELVQRCGPFRRVLHLNSRIIFDMDTRAIARDVHSQFLKFPCVIQNHPLTFTLVWHPKPKRKPPVKGTQPAAKPGEAWKKGPAASLKVPAGGAKAPAKTTVAQAKAKTAKTQLLAANKANAKTTKTKANAVILISDTDSESDANKAKKANAANANKANANKANANKTNVNAKPAGAAAAPKAVTTTAPPTVTHTATTATTTTASAAAVTSTTATTAAIAASDGTPAASDRTTAPKAVTTTAPPTVTPTTTTTTTTTASAATTAAIAASGATTAATGSATANSTTETGTKMDTQDANQADNRTVEESSEPAAKGVTAEEVVVATPSDKTEGDEMAPGDIQGGPQAVTVPEGEGVNVPMKQGKTEGEKTGSEKDAIASSSSGESSVAVIPSAEAIETRSVSTEALGTEDKQGDLTETIPGQVDSDPQTSNQSQPDKPDTKTTAATPAPSVSVDPVVVETNSSTPVAAPVALVVPVTIDDPQTSNQSQPDKPDPETAAATPAPSVSVDPVVVETNSSTPVAAPVALVVPVTIDDPQTSNQSQPDKPDTETSTATPAQSVSVDPVIVETNSSTPVAAPVALVVPVTIDDPQTSNQSQPDKPDTETSTATPAQSVSVDPVIVETNSSTPVAAPVALVVPVTIDDPQTSNQSQPDKPDTETAAATPAPVTIDDKLLDFPPVTQEILRALEAAVHLKRAERAEEQAKLKQSDAEKKTPSDKPKTPQASKKPTLAEKSPQMPKKPAQADCKKSQPDQGKKPQSSGGKSRHGEASSPERASSRHRSKEKDEEQPPSTRRGGSSSSNSSASRRSRQESSPVAKRAKVLEDDCKHKSHSTSKITRTSKSDSKAKKEEKTEELDEMFEDSFPFNLDEFVTVDEVGDDVGEETSPAPEPVAKRKRSQDTPKTPDPTPAQKKPAATAQKKSPPAAKARPVKKAPPKPTSRRTRSGAALETAAQEAGEDVAEMEVEPEDSKPIAVVVEQHEQEEEEEPKKTDSAAAVTAGQQGAVSEKEQKAECVTAAKPTAATTSALPTGAEVEDTKAETGAEQASYIQAESSLDGSSALPAASQTDDSTSELKQDAQSTPKEQASEKAAEGDQVAETPLDTQTSVAQTEAEGKEDATPAPLPDSQNTLVVLDEVSEEEEDYSDDEAEEEELLKRQAGEDPEALVTVDEVGGDEAGGEEGEGQEDNLQTLVAVDEVKGDEAGGEEGEGQEDNLQTLVTVDEVGGDEAADEEGEGPEDNLQTLVTLDEIVEDEEEEEEEEEEGAKQDVSSDALLDSQEEESGDAFNPETLVTLDEAKGDDDEEEEEESKNPSPDEATPQPSDITEEPAGSPGLDEEGRGLEELHQMNFVTVDEVGEEEEEEVQPPEEEEEEQQQEEVAVTTRRRGRAKRRGRQTPVRKSTRGKRASGKAKEEVEEEGETPAVEAPAPGPAASQPKDSSPVTDLANAENKPPPSAPEPQGEEAETPADAPRREAASAGQEKEEEATQDQDVSGGPSVKLDPLVTSEPAADTRSAIKEESKQRRVDELKQQTEAKRSRSESPLNRNLTLPPFSPDSPIGVDFVVPKSGYFCKLCSLFYDREDSAKRSHCSSLRHYQSMEKYYKNLKSQQQGGSSSQTPSHGSASE